MLNTLLEILDNVNSLILKEIQEQMNEIVNYPTYSNDEADIVYKLCKAYLRVNSKSGSDSDIPFHYVDTLDRHNTYDILDMTENILDDSSIRLDSVESHNDRYIPKISENAPNITMALYLYLSDVFINVKYPRIKFDW